eukprot:4481658-Prymnesium_polylepis.1
MHPTRNRRAVIGLTGGSSKAHTSCCTRAAMVSSSSSLLSERPHRPTRCDLDRRRPGDRHF